MRSYHTKNIDALKNTYKKYSTSKAHFSKKVDYSLSVFTIDHQISFISDIKAISVNYLKNFFINPYIKNTMNGFSSYYKAS